MGSLYSPISVNNFPTWPQRYFLISGCLFLFFVGHMPFLLGHWYPCFGLLVTSPVGVKAIVGSLIFAFFLLFLSLIFFITSLIIVSIAPAFASCERALEVQYSTPYLSKLSYYETFISFTDLPTQWLYIGHFHFRFVAISVKGETI